jgi:S-formylglutathione hydrolase FrmB
MIKHGVPHEYNVRDGTHNWTYWKTGLADALAFIGEGF